MYDVVIYRKDIQSIGGIETWLINLARRYGKTHKLAFVYANAHPDTLRELARYAEIIKYEGQTVHSKKAFFCYDFLGFETSVAEERIHVVHADHSELSFKFHRPEGIDRTISVSEVARRGLLKADGIDSEVGYNPVDIDHAPRILKLVSGTRLTSEKGLDRMIKLAQALDASGALYEWHIFTNQGGIKPFSPNVIFREPTRHLLSYVKDADFLVQLSDTESYGYSIVEALSIGTPVVVTDIPVLGELGITEDCAVIMPLKNANYAEVSQKIVEKRFKFHYSPPKDSWDELFGEGTGNDYVSRFVTVQNVYGRRLTLLEEGVTLDPNGTTTIFNPKRAELLESQGFIKVLY